MERFTRTLHVGPWFFAEAAQLKNGIYRGQPWQFHGSFANGNTGYLQIELIQQADDAPSPYTEVIKKRGYGLHHQGIAVRDFDAQLKAYAALGYEIAADSGGRRPGRAVYVDTKGEFPFFVEVTEISKSSETMFTKFYQASVRWDGKDPIRVVK
jgi:Glyoxalase/Bleomycin resistance protein/Dioxygenase superfamily